MIKAWHGSPYVFNSFNDSKLGKATKIFDDENDSSKQGFFFTDDKEYAKGYTNGTGCLYHCALNLNNPLEIDLDEYMATDEVITKFIKQAKSEGHDGVIFRNIRELGRPKATEYVVFDDNDIQILDRLVENVFTQLNSLIETYI